MRSFQLGTLSRRPEEGDSAAQMGYTGMESADEQSEDKSLEPRANLRFPRRLSNMTLQGPHCWRCTAPCQRNRY